MVTLRDNLRPDTHGCDTNIKHALRRKQSLCNFSPYGISAEATGCPDRMCYEDPPGPN
jgi:hypothetical protein